jgi:alkanesulfonate monooxygenase SsuD/methylene tetrahydromethanopterin reductase-like flavin-dependent oxidoreductase (luciferase family)
MHYGIEVVPFGGFADPRAVVELAVAAEAAGWEGIILWDHVNFPYGAGDPWIMLAAVAASTRRLKLCTGVAPMPRYRPHLLARTLAGLDLLSQGRVIFGTGLGVEWDFAPFGEPGDDKTRAAMADEGLELLIQLLSGEETTHHGRFYTAEAVRLATLPVQQPRIPVWIGGASKAGLRRAARWDGWVMGTIDEAGNVTTPPAKIAADVAYIFDHRTDDAPFDVAVDGITQPGERGLVQEYADAGVTWWFEAIYQTRADHAALLQRIAAGPPR